MVLPDFFASANASFQVPLKKRMPASTAACLSDVSICAFIAFKSAVFKRIVWASTRTPPKNAIMLKNAIKKVDFIILNIFNVIVFSTPYP